MNALQVLSRGPAIALSLGVVLSGTGCYIESEHHHHGHRDAEPYAPAPVTTPPPPVAEDPATDLPASPGTMLVEVDTDQAMTVVGGDGVGVFIEYGKGGHWHISWTCDTNQTRQSCDFAIRATVATGEITNLDTTDLGSGSAKSPMASRIDVSSTTTTDIHAVRFDTAPGAILTVEAAVGALTDGAFLFFVQDGKINGGFTGKLSNPLQLQGSTP